MDHKLLHGPILFPSDFDDLMLKELIESCLERNPAARISVPQVIMHDYFQKNDTTESTKMSSLHQRDARVPGTSEAQRVVQEYRKSISKLPTENDLEIIIRSKSETISCARASYMSIPERPCTPTPPTPTSPDRICTPPPCSTPDPSTPITINTALRCAPEMSKKEQIKLFCDQLEAEVKSPSKRKLRKIHHSSDFNMPNPKKGATLKSMVSSVSLALSNVSKDPLPNGLYWMGEGIGYEYSPRKRSRMGCHPGIRSLVQVNRPILSQQKLGTSQPFSPKKEEDGEQWKTVRIGSPRKGLRPLKSRVTKRVPPPPTPTTTRSSSYERVSSSDSTGPLTPDTEWCSPPLPRKTALV